MSSLLETTSDTSAKAVAPPLTAEAQSALVNSAGILDFSSAASHLPGEMHGKIDGFKARFDGKSVSDLLKSYGELEAQFSATRVVGAVPDAATLDAYGITQPEGLADDSWGADSKVIEKYVQIAHEVGIGKEAFSKLFGAYSDALTKDQADAETSQHQAMKVASDELLKVWGGEFEAKRVTTMNFTQSVFDDLQIDASSPNANALLNNPIFIMAMHNAALQVNKNQGESSQTIVPLGGASVYVSSAELAHDIMTNPANAQHEKFMEESRRGGGQTVDYVMRMRSSKNS